MALVLCGVAGSRLQAQMNRMFDEISWLARVAAPSGAQPMQWAPALDGCTRTGFVCGPRCPCEQEDVDVSCTAGC